MEGFELGTLFRFEDPTFKRISDNLSYLGERPKLAKRDHLHQQVPDRRCLYRTGYNRSPTSICGQLVQKRILTPTTENVNGIQTSTNKDLKLVDIRTILLRQALQD